MSNAVAANQCVRARAQSDNGCTGRARNCEDFPWFAPARGPTFYYVLLARKLSHPSRMRNGCK
eukprot:7233928-Lingulodinium_polyedra.AAC.1